MISEKVTLANICRGGVEEVFQRALASVIENIKDASTEEEAKRKIGIEFEFLPYPDRSGSVVTFKVTSKLEGVKPCGGTIHLGYDHGELVAFPRDPRQEMLFEEKSKGPTQ